MKLSTKGEYGLLAVIDLALHSLEAPVQSAQIAERQNIPKQYLDQLLLFLKKAGLIESSRGRQGGYQLARSASHINLLQVVAGAGGFDRQQRRFHERGGEPGSNPQDSQRSLGGDI